MSGRIRPVERDDYLPEVPPDLRKTLFQQDSVGQERLCYTVPAEDLANGRKVTAEEWLAAGGDDMPQAIIDHLVCYRREVLKRKFFKERMARPARAAAQIAPFPHG